jgi:hypothetical protein
LIICRNFSHYKSYVYQKKSTNSSYAYLYTNLSNAQEIERKNIIKANFFSPVVSTASFFYERVVDKNISLQFGLAYTGYTEKEFDAKTSVNGFYVTPEFRYYASKGAPRGFFIAPYLRYMNFNLKASGKSFSSNGVSIESRATLTSFGGGAIVGGQWLFNDRVSFEIFGGPNYSINNIKVKQGKESDFGTEEVTNMRLRFGLTVGVAF